MFKGHDMDANCVELQSTWHAGIPVAAAMGVEVAGFADDELVVRAGLDPNINVHGTAFAGSLYSIAALAGWGLAWLKLRDAGFDGQIVLAEGHIQYLTAVAEDVVCRCRFDPELHGPKLAALARSSRTTLRLHCEIDAGGGPAVRFEGLYAIRKR